MHIRQRYSQDVTVVTERPPRIEMGEVATPVCFELAKRLKRAPRQIAQEIAVELPPIDGVARVEVAGGGYVNLYFSRAAFLAASVAGAAVTPPVARPDAAKYIVEHTNINPNKAAHIGHLRNAALGDTLVRLLRRAGRRVEVQNYIDNTGVQVADVVIGFINIAKKSPEEVRALAAQPKFDYFCWDLYASVTHFYEEDKTRLALRGETLHSIEAGHGAAAEMAGAVAPAVVRCHLRTMERLAIEYDLLPRESEILHLKFWDAAFEHLKQRNAIHLAASGKNAGCWVMRLNDAADTADGSGEEADAKIIVRSNGTVTYVGKDIAYQLWKFGLLGKDFHYAKWANAPEGEEVWATTSGATDPNAPHFGAPAQMVYNVIDTRQAYVQDVVAQGLRGLGHAEAAKNSIHLSYEIVALTPRCAAEMGYELSPEEAKKPYVEVSGRKGFGVKADDLIDRLEAATLAEVQQRHAETNADEQKLTAHAIAVGALRFFLLKFTRNAIIAFDFKDALSFEGETGPYCQYAVVRIRGIRRKGAETGADMTSVVSVEEAARILKMSEGEAAKRFLEGPENNDLWELLLAAGSLDHAVEAA